MDNFPAEPVERVELSETVLDRYDVGGATATYSTDENLGISPPSWKQNDQGFVLKSIPNCAGNEPPPLDTML